VLNKVDAIEAEEIGAIEAALAEASGGPVMRMSGVAQVGTVEVLRALRTQIDEGRLREKAGEDEEEAWRP
jgi:GTP-binding protein